MIATSMTGSGNQRTVRAGRGAGAAVVASLAALAACALPAAAGAGEIVVKERRAGERAIANYWTPERIARARPLELVRKRDGEAVVRRGEKDPLNHPANFESGQVPDPAVAPNTVNGKLLGKIKGVGGYECSATAVDAANRNLIMTAGHCVAEPASRTLAKKLAFIPSYQEEVRPFGTWVFDRIVVLRSWKRNSNFNYDFAAVRLEPRHGDGANLQDVVGGAPIATQLPVDQTYTAIGYPSNINEGQVMRFCVSGFQGFDPHPIENGPRPMAMGCDMGPGASGGGWFVDGYLASVTSFGYQDHPDISYGPYFGGKLRDVYSRGAR